MYLHGIFLQLLSDLVAVAIVIVLAQHSPNGMHHSFVFHTRTHRYVIFFFNLEMIGTLLTDLLETITKLPVKSHSILTMQ